MEPQNNLPYAGSSLQNLEGKCEVTLQFPCPLAWGQECPHGSSGCTAWLSQRVGRMETGRPGQPPVLCGGCTLGSTLPSQGGTWAEGAHSNGAYLQPVSHICLRWAKSGQSRAGGAAGLWEPAESATSRLGQEPCHAAQHQQGSSAAELGCCRPYITLVAKRLPAPAGLGALVLPGWGGHPGPLLESHPPSQGVVQGDARGIGTRHPPAAWLCGQGRAGQKWCRTSPQPGELLLSYGSHLAPGVNRHLQQGFCHQTQRAPQREAVGKLQTVQLGV